MGASGRMMLGITGFFVIFPGIGMFLALYFIGLFAWEAQEYTMLCILHVILIPWVVVTLLALLTDGLGVVGLVFAYPYSFITASMMFFLPAVEDFQELSWFSLSRQSIEQVGLFAIFVPLLLILLGLVTHPTGVAVGQAMRGLASRAFRVE